MTPIRKKTIIGGLVILAVVLVPYVSAKLYYGDRVAFDPGAFANEYIKFITGLVAMFISFWLANSYWVDKTKLERIQRVRNVMMRFFRWILSTASECKDLLKASYGEAQIRESQERDRKVTELFQELKLAKEGLLLHYPAGEIEEDEKLAQAMIGLFWESMIPAINDLSTRQTIRGDTEELDEIRRQLGTINATAEQACQLLELRKPTRKMVLEQVRRRK